MLQFHELIRPISEVAPCGADLTFSPQVDAIDQARRSDDPTLDQGEWVTSLKEANWEFVYTQCLALLGTQTKDLRLLGWLVEAAAKTRQFEGMAAGLDVMAKLCQSYWDELHPELDDGDADRRVGNLAWLATRAVQLVREIPITEGRSTAFSWNDFESARVRASNAVRTGDVIPGSGDQPNLAMLESARRKSSTTFYSQLRLDAECCRTATNELERALDARLGVNGPSFTPLKEILDVVLSTIERFGNDVGLRSDVSGSELPARDESMNAIPVSSIDSVVAGPIQTREQALDQLRKVAEFFRRTEPHSPVAYLADKAASWGRLSLHTWLKTVVKDPNSLASIEELLGVDSSKLDAVTELNR